MSLGLGVVFRVFVGFFLFFILGWWILLLFLWFVRAGSLLLFGGIFLLDAVVFLDLFNLRVFVLLARKHLRLYLLFNHVLSLCFGRKVSLLILREEFLGASFIFRLFRLELSLTTSSSASASSTSSRWRGWKVSHLLVVIIGTSWIILHIFHVIRGIWPLLGRHFLIFWLVRFVIVIWSRRRRISGLPVIILRLLHRRLAITRIWLLLVRIRLRLLRIILILGWILPLFLMLKFRRPLIVLRFELLICLCPVVVIILSIVVRILLVLFIVMGVFWWFLTILILIVEPCIVMRYIWRPVSRLLGMILGIRWVWFWLIVVGSVGMGLVGVLSFWIVVLMMFWVCLVVVVGRPICLLIGVGAMVSP